MRSSIQALTWKQVRSSVIDVNPTLAKIIDTINPSQQYRLYKVVYNYGDEILCNGSLYLPNSKSDLVPLKDNTIKKSVQDDLGYNLGANPVGLVLKNSVELFIKSEERIIPFSLISPGRAFGMWRLLDSNISHCPLYFLWGMTAGARSMFMLPKISREISHNRLRQQFQMDVAKPNCFRDHWYVFKEIARRSKSPWQVEMLFFSKHWFKRLNDPAWAEFHRYLLSEAWASSGYWRNQFIWQAIFNLIQSKLNIKTSAYLSDLVQHIFIVGVGALPGFAPAINNTAGPIDEIQDAYLECYSLEHYIPNIMQPCSFSMYDNKHQRPVYLSLQCPSAMKLAPKTSSRHNALEEVIKIRSIVDDYFNVLLEDPFNIGETPLATLPRCVRFDCFHSDPKKLLHVKPSEKMFMEDPAFRKLPVKYKKARYFSANSPFLHGCMRISKKLTSPITH